MADQNQPASRLKQYYVLRDHEEKGLGDWHEGEIIDIDPEVAIPYIGARILIPLASAIRTKIIPPLDPKLAQQIELESHAPSTFNAVVDPDKDKNTKKTLIKNTLKEAVQDKKSTNPETESTEMPVAPAEEKPTRELSAHEKAIQAKIAALKKNK